MKKLLALLAFALTACPTLPMSQVQSSNPEIRVELLTKTEDGCKVYRLYDYSRPVYFVRCPKADVQTTYQATKHIVDNVQTVDE